MSESAAAGSVGHPATRAALGGAARSAERAARHPGGRLGFLALLAYVALEYARPQDLVPGLAAVPLGILGALPLALSIAREHERLEPVEGVLVPFGLLLLQMALWVPLATNNFWAFQVLKMHVLYALVVLSFVAFVTTEQRVRWVVRVWIAVLSLQAAHGLVSEGRGTGAYFGDENDLAAAMCVGFGLAFFGARAERGLVAWAMRGAMLFFVAAVVASASRGGLVGLAATAAAVFLLTPARLRLVAAGVVGAVVLAAAAPAHYWDEMSTIFDSNASTRVERFRHWDLSLAMFERNPLVGVGQGNIAWTVSRVEVFDTSQERSLAGREVHSAWFTLIAELGLLGIALYVAIVWGALRAAALALRRGSRTLAETTRGLLAAAAGWAACGLFISILYYPHPYFLLGGILAVRRIADGRAYGAAE